MPYTIEKDHSDCPSSKPWAVIKKDDGKKMGCHATKSAAQDQIGAIETNEKAEMVGNTGVWFEAESSFHIGARAELLPEDREIAGHWASKHITPNPAHSYVLGRYAESGRANNNKQMFSLDGLQLGKTSLAHAPMNMNHSNRRVVGAFVASEIMYPVKTKEDLDVAQTPELNPFMESLAVLWKHYFPDEYRAVAAAQAEGALFYSMEAVPNSVKCVGENGCGLEFAYEGPQSKSYCEHLNERSSDKLLVDPHFVGGALIVPPAKPGWSYANITDVAAEDQERLHKQISAEFDHLDSTEWETLMHQIVSLSATS